MTRLLIEPLGKSHDRAAFSCGQPTLDTYLKEAAGQDMRKRTAIAYVLTDEGHRVICGYYTLSASSAPLGEFPHEITKRLSKYPDVPVTIIGRLAVSLEHQKKGHGESLLMDALRVSFENSFRIASAAVVVDAKNEASAAFYRRFGFIPVGARPLRLLIPMKTIEHLLLKP